MSPGLRSRRPVFLPPPQVRAACSSAASVSSPLFSSLLSRFPFLNLFPCSFFSSFSLSPFSVASCLSRPVCRVLSVASCLLRPVCCGGVFVAVTVFCRWTSLMFRPAFRCFILPCRAVAACRPDILFFPVFVTPGISAPFRPRPFPEKNLPRLTAVPALRAASAKITPFPVLSGAIIRTRPAILLTIWQRLPFGTTFVQIQGVTGAPDPQGKRTRAARKRNTNN